MTFSVGISVDKDGNEIPAVDNYDRLVDLLKGDEKLIADGYGLNAIVIDGVNDKKKATLCLNKVNVTINASFINKLTGPIVGKWTIRDGGVYLANNDYTTPDCKKRLNYFVALLDRDTSEQETSDK